MEEKTNVATPVSRGDDVRLLVGVCSGRGWSARTSHCYGELMLWLGLNRLGGRLVGIEANVHYQAYLVKARNDLLVHAIERGYTHFLSLDDDMTFPKNLVDRLLAWDKPVVTCNYAKKKLGPAEGTVAYGNGTHIDSTEHTGITQVKSMGMGAVLIKIDAIKNLPRPFFAVVWSKDQNEYLIEDGVFSRLLDEHNVEVWCDHDLSREIGHMGEVEFKLPQFTQPRLGQLTVPLHDPPVDLTRHSADAAYKAA